MTQAEIKKAIKQCEWRLKVCRDKYVCKGMCGMCQRVIEKGQCDTLKKLFKVEPYERKE